MIPHPLPTATWWSDGLVMRRAQKRAKLPGQGWSGDFDALTPLRKDIIWFMARLQTWPTVHFWLSFAVLRLRDYFTYVPLPGQERLASTSPTLAIGGMPLPWQIRSMHSRGIRGIVNVCDEFEGYPGLYSELGVEQCRCPTVDYCNVSPKNIAKGVSFIHRKVQVRSALLRRSRLREKTGEITGCGSILTSEWQAGESVYVHCKSGIGRCAMVLVCYFATHHNMSVEEANAYVKSWRKVPPRQTRAHLTALPASLVSNFT
eukprot:1598866-Rhodomonas_salina.2